MSSSQTCQAWPRDSRRQRLNSWSLRAERATSFMLNFACIIAPYCSSDIKTGKGNVRYANRAEVGRGGPAALDGHALQAHQAAQVGDFAQVRESVSQAHVADGALDWHFAEGLPRGHLLEEDVICSRQEGVGGLPDDLHIVVEGLR